jgi:hypothetical protein
MLIKLLFQVDGDGYLDARKTITLIKAKDLWGQLFSDKDNILNRCVTFSNSFAKGKLNSPIKGPGYILKVTNIK